MGLHYAARNPALKWSLWLIDHVLAMFYGRRTVNRVHSPERVLVCMQAHLGDAILATAVIPALQKRFPQARLGFLVHPASVQVIEGNTGISWIHAVEHWRLNRQHRSWGLRLWQHWKSTRACVKSVRAVKYDLAIDLYHHFPNSIPLLRRSGIRRIVGWSSGGFWPWLDDVAHDQGQPVNILQRHAELLRLIDADVGTQPLRPQIEVSASAAQRWSGISLTRGLSGHYVALHVGAQAAYKLWQPSRWTEAAKQLAGSGQTLVLLGHRAGEVAICGQIARSCPTAIDLSGQLQWDELVAAIAACTLLVAHDSAAIHLAAAFDKPRICITTGIMDARIWSQASPRSVVLVHTMPCSPCQKLRGCRTMDCIRRVTTDSVLASAQRLLGPAAACLGPDPGAHCPEP